MSDLFGETTTVRYARLAELAKSSGKWLEIGKAAEHLVCADLLLQGYRAYLGDQGLPYDVIADLGSRFVRVQVKSTCFTKLDHKRQVYWFKPRCWTGGGKKRLVNAQDCDVLALVALDIRTVAYWPVSLATDSIKLRPPSSVKNGKGRTPLAPIDCYPFASAIVEG